MNHTLTTLSRGASGAAFLLAAFATLWATAPAAGLATHPVGQQAATRPSSAVQRSTAVLLLKNAASAGRPGGFDIRTVGEIMTSTAFVDGAVKAALGLEPRQWPNYVQIELAPAGEQSLKILVTVRPRESVELPPQPAVVLLDELVKRAQQEVARVAGDQRPQLQEQIAQLKKRRDELAAERQQLEQRLAELQKHPSLGGRSSPDPTIAQRLQIQEQLQRNRLRLEALEAMLPKFEDIYRGMESPLDELVELHQRKVKILERQVEAGQAGPVELLDAQIALAEVRSRRSGLGSDADGRSSPLLRYYNEIISLRVEVGVGEAQLAMLGGPVTRPAVAGMTQDEARRLVMEATQALADVQRQQSLVTSELDNAQRRLEAMGAPPQLVVLDGEANGG